LTVREVLRTYLLVLLAPFALLGPILLSGQALFWGTPALQFVPWWWQAWQSLRQGALPLWNPNSGLGAPLLANYQAAFFYPPNWLLLGMAGLGGPPAIAWGYTLLAALHLAWAGLGMALLLRKLGFAWPGQMMGGLAFGLSGYVVARLGFFSMVWVAAWLPWVIFFADRVAGLSPRSQEALRGRLSLPVGLAGCLAMQLLAGHAQLAWYTLLLAGLWVTVGGLRAGGPRGVPRAWGALMLASGLAAGIAAVQLVPTFEYLRVSQRADAFAYQEALTYSFWPWRFLTLFSPDIFGSPAQGDYWGYASYWEDHLYAGLLPLLLALSTLVLLARGLRPARRDPRWGLILFAWALLAAAFLLALGRNTPVFPFLYRWVPTFDMFQAPARFLIWVAFALPLLAAVGAEQWRCPTGRGLYWFRLATAGAFAVTLGAGLAWLLMRDIRLTFVRATALTGVWGLGFGLLTLAIPLAQKHRRTTLWQWCVLAWVLADLLATGWALNPGVRLDFYGASPPAVQALRVTAPGQRVYLSAQEEYDLKFLRFLRFDDFRPIEDWRAMRAALIPNLNLLDGIASTSNFDPLVTERYARWMAEIETLDPTAQLGWLAEMNAGVVERIDGRAEGNVRFDRVVNPLRLRWYGCAHMAAGYEEAWSALLPEFDAPPRPERAVILEMPEDRPTRCVQDSLIVASIVEDRPDRVTIRVEGSQGGWLVLADAWYPGWVARIDRNSAPIYPADTLFRAVYVDPGVHKITFLYRPTGFYFGALSSILVLSSIAVFYRFRGGGTVLPPSLR
jgi:hypothetical protein